MNTRILNYTFDASLKEVTFDDYITIDIERIALIVNLTSNFVIYNFAGKNKGGTVAGNILTLDYNTTLMSDLDPLFIVYDDPLIPLLVTGSLSVSLPTGASTEAKQDNIISLLSGTLTVDTGLLQGLTDTQLRASPVPISGTVTANTGLSQPLTDAQLRATPVPISGTITVDTSLLATEATLSNIDSNIPSGLTVTSTRLLVDGSGVTQPVSGTFWQATQPVSLATLPALVAGTTIIGKVGIDQTTPGTTNKVTLGTDVVHTIIDSASLGTVTISGSVTANAGTNLNTSLLALESGGNLATIAAIDFATQTTLALIKAKTDNLDVLLSSRLKPADTLTAITTVGTITNVVHVDDNSSTLSIDDGAGSITVDGTVAFSNTTIAVTNAGTFATQDSEKLADNAGFTDGTTKLQPIGYIYDEVAGTSLTENDIAAARINVNRSQVMVIEDGSTRGQVASVHSTGGLYINVRTLNSSTISLGAGSVAAGTQRVVLATDQSVIPVSDNSGSLTIDNAALSVVGGGVEATALRVTIASDSTGVLSVDDNGSSLTVDGTVTANLAAGSNLIGSVNLSDGTDIADILDLANSNPLVVAIVDASGDQITSFGGGTQYTEDAAAAANPIGTANILIRQDTPSGLTTTDGDNVAQRGTDYGAAFVQILTSSGSFIDSFGGGTQYTEDAASAANPVGTQLIARRRDSLAGETTTDGDNVAVNSTDNGELYVKHVDAIPITDNSGSLTVDNGGTFVIQESGAALTSLQLIDDTVFTDDTSTHSTGVTKGLGIMAVAVPTDTSISANDIGMLAMTTDRRLLVDASGVAVPITDNSSSITIDYATTGSGTATGALRVELPTNGTGVIATVGTITNAVTVNAHAVTNAGVFAVQVDGNALTALQLIDDPIVTLGTTTYTEATTKANIIGAVRRDADTTLVDTTNEIAPLQVNAGGQLKVAVIAALPAGSAAIGKLAANSGVDIGDVDVTSISAGTNYIGKVRLTDGTLDSNIVDETGSSAVDALAVGGGTPSDSVDSGNPVKIGFLAKSSFPTAVATGDRANGISDLYGRQLVSHIDAAQQIWKSYNDTSSRAAGSAQIIWTPTSGKKIAITSVTIAAYGTTAARMFLFFAANADLTYSAGTDQPVFVGSFAPSSTSKPGVVITPAVPIIANTADYKLLYQNDAALSVDIVVHGYEL